MIVSPASSSVQHLVVTTCVAAILRPVNHQTTLTEKDWNEFSDQEGKVKGKDATNIHKYRATSLIRYEPRHGALKRQFINHHRRPQERRYTEKRPRIVDEVKPEQVIASCMDDAEDLARPYKDFFKYLPLTTTTN
ncbi:hypothetical protein JB92DRAFT_2883060 [Gautieria morchelliformis]|nr:hypothetical protein JB92DRAFT_2883060 [Gautieria morchelliformis]